MKIYFCDICNESIPVRDLETGAAITVKGKVICRTCNPSAGARSPAAGTGTARAAGLAFLAFLAAAGAGIGYTHYRERATSAQLGSLENGVRRDQSQRLGEVDRRLGQFEDRLGGADRRVGEVAQSFEEGSRLAEKDREELRARFDRVQGYIRENEELKHRLERLEIRQTALDEGSARQAGSIEALRAEVKGIGERPAAAPAAPALPVAEKKEDASVRWEAVSELAKSGNPRVIPFLVPLLKDEDDFVRHNAALTLGELDAKSAVPALLDALGDSNPIVRDSTITALRRITRQNLKFDPHASKEERDRALRAWRQWWQASGEKFLND